MLLSAAVYVLISLDLGFTYHRTAMTRALRGSMRTTVDCYRGSTSDGVNAFSPVLVLEPGMVSVSYARVVETVTLLTLLVRALD
jgi:hypothetical protein